jgi:hypothetical protein
MIFSSQDFVECAFSYVFGKSAHSEKAKDTKKAPKNHLQIPLLFIQF